MESHEHGHVPLVIIKQRDLPIQLSYYYQLSKQGSAQCYTGNELVIKL